MPESRKPRTRDYDFNGLRRANALARLPEAERDDGNQLWQEVESLRQRAAGTPKDPESAGR